MKKKTRLVFQMVLALVLCFSVVVTSSAESGSQNKSEPTSLKSYRVTANGLVEITQEQVDALKKEAELYEKKREAFKASVEANKSVETGTVGSQELITPLYFCPGASCSWDEYKESNNYLTPRLSKKKRVTPAVAPNGSASFSVSESYTLEVNLSLTASLKKAFEIVLGTTWAASSTYQNTLNVTAPYNQYAWYDFTPIMRNSYGITEHWLHDYSTNYQDTVVGTSFTDIYMTVKVGNFQDGILTLVTSDNPPTY